MSETIEHAGCTIEIWQDADCESPREWDNLGTMVLFHGRYNLANELDLRQEDYNGWEEVEDAIHERLGDMLILPVYMYDHSGVGLSTDNSQYPFNCPWDAGKVGYIAVSLAKVAEEYASLPTMDQEGRERAAKAVLRSEVETYSQWLNGECFGYTVTRGDEEETVGGFIGYENCLEEAKHQAEELGTKAVAV